jgi:hypothetical protein
MKYADALKLIAKARDRHSGYRLPGREGRTRLLQRMTGMAIKYTHTDVVTIHSDDSITLNSGGWNTKTTRDRFEYAEQVRVFTEGGKMYVCQSGKYPWSALWNQPRKSKDEPKYVWEFKDGMTFNANGTICLNAIQLGITKWTPKNWAKYIREERNRKARERRNDKKIEAQRKVEREAKRKIEQENIVVQTQPSDIIRSIPVVSTIHPFVWPTVFRGGR